MQRYCKKYLLLLYIMKIFIFIFSIYLLALSLVPCSDAFNECQNIEVDYSHDHEHNHESDHDDNCTPFCTCSCCGTSMIFNLTLMPFLKLRDKILLSNEVINSESSFCSSFYGAIWQPPKL